MSTILAATCGGVVVGYVARMDLAVLAVWIPTILLGLYMWGRASRFAQPPRDVRNTHLPSMLVFLHPLLGVSGLVLWAAYLETRASELAWVAFVVLVVIAALDSLLLTRWWEEHRARADTATPEERAAGRLPPAEHAVPPIAVAFYVLLLATTLVLALVAALQA